MNSEVMVHTSSVETDTTKGGLITALEFTAENKVYRVKRIRGEYRISTEKGVINEVIDEDFYRDVDLAMRAYSKVQEDQKNKVEVE